MLTLVAKLKAEEDRKRSLTHEMESVQHQEAIASLNEDDVRERGAGGRPIYAEF